MKIFKTQKEYNDAVNKLTAYNEAVRYYCKKHKTNGIPVAVTETFPYADEVDNELRSAVEHFQFKLDCPTKAFVYVSEKKGEAITWMGQRLGRVWFGNKYRSKMGDVRIPIDVYGINGVAYHGIFYKGAGDYARLTAYKNQEKTISRWNIKRA